MSEDMLAAAYMDLSRNKTGRHRPIYNATEADTLRGGTTSPPMSGTSCASACSPGCRPPAEPSPADGDEYQNIYGKRYTLGGEISRTFTGVSPVSRDITGSAIAYASSYKALMGESVLVVSNRLRGEDPSDQDIRDAVLSMETSRQVFWVRTLEIIDAARRFGKTPREIRTIPTPRASPAAALRPAGRALPRMARVRPVHAGARRGHWPARRKERRRRVGPAAQGCQRLCEGRSEDLRILRKGIRKR